jgi:hypothetical protein
MCVVEREAVNFELLKSVIEDAGYQAEITSVEGDRIVVNGFDTTCYITFDEKYEFVIMRTYIICTDNIPADNLHELVCKLNKKLLVQFLYTEHDDGTICIDGFYVMPYKFGFNTKNFIDSLDAFASIFNEGFRELDEDIVSMH